MTEWSSAKGVDFRRKESVNIEMGTRGVVIFLSFIFARSAIAAPENLQVLREQMRALVMSRSCVNCHTPDGVGAKQRILSVYNLKNKNWSATLDDNKLQGFESRMLGLVTPPGLPKSAKNMDRKPLTQAEQELVSTFVREELEFRKSFPNERQHELDENKRTALLSVLGVIPKND